MRTKNQVETGKKSKRLYRIAKKKKNEMKKKKKKKWNPKEEKKRMLDYARQSIDNFAHRVVSATL